MKLRVWYGLRKLTAKAIRKPSIIVMFENSQYWKNEGYVKRAMEIIHVRHQSDDEKKDAEGCSRVLSAYELFFMDDKRYKKSPELAIQANFNADSNNVSEEERILIAEKLRARIYDFYGVTEPDSVQLNLF